MKRTTNVAASPTDHQPSRVLGRLKMRPSMADLTVAHSLVVLNQFSSHTSCLKHKKRQSIGSNCSPPYLGCPTVGYTAI
jgi:hypothetical protein